MLFWLHVWWYLQHLNNLFLHVVYACWLPIKKILKLSRNSKKATSCLYSWGCTIFSGKTLAVSHLPLDALPAVQTWTANCKLDRRPCLVHVRRFPRLSGSINFGDVPEANIFAWTTWPETLWPLGIMRPKGRTKIFSKMYTQWERRKPLGVDILAANETHTLWFLIFVKSTSGSVAVVD